MRAFLNRLISGIHRSPAPMLVIAALLVATAIAVPVTVAATVHTAVTSASPSKPKPLSMGTYPATRYAAAASKIPGGLRTAVRRDLGITSEQYLADAAAAEQGVKVIASLKAAGVDVLGSKINGTKLSINVASAADVAAVKAVGATAVIGAPKTLNVSDVKFHSVATNNTYGGQGYFFQQSGQSGGNGFRCSIGFNGYGESTGAPQFVTAGHCATTISGNATLLSQSLPTDNGGSTSVVQTLGATVPGEAQYGSGRDYGIVSEAAAGLSPQPAIYSWGGNEAGTTGTSGPLSNTPLTITGETSALTNGLLCKSGSTSGWTCGTILAVDATASVSGQLVNTIVATTCLLPGDSGGGAVVGSNAVGIDSGSDFPSTNITTSSCNNGPSCATDSNNNPVQCESVFFPMVSSASGQNNTVIGQQGNNWELAVPVTGTPVVTGITPSSGTTIDTYSVMSGTLASPAANSTVLLYLDGSTTPFARASAASGNWSIPLSGMSVGTHTYSLAAGLGWSPSPTPATGTLVFSANAVPVGVIDSATTGPGTISVLGWDYDPGTTGPIQVGVTLDGVAQSSVTANTVKTGFNNSFPGYGDNHGYSVSLSSVSGGSHTVCIYGINAGFGANEPPLCSVVVVPTGNPVGVIDTATASPGNITITGWMLDPDTASAISVGWTVDGLAQTAVVANGVKSGLGAAFPGYGDNHDYTLTASIGGGTHTVCVYGINVGGGTNSAPICRSVAVPTGNPTGVIDTAVVTPGSPANITITGWMLDPDTISAIQVGVTLDGVAQSAVTANGVKTGLGAAFPGYGDNHDYTVSLSPATGGTHTVCVYGINVGGGTNSAPICRSVAVPTGNPTGVIDTAVVTPGSPANITITGWMLDPDTASAISVGWTVDGLAQTAVVANGVKSGLGAAFPGYGDNHDYTLTASIGGGTHTVCVYGINVGGGTNSPPICRSVAVPTGNPTGVIDTAVVTPGSPANITITGWMLDPDTISAIQVGVTLDGVAQSAVTANGVKTGLGAAFPGYGDNHDYTVSLSPATGGTHTVCVYGINVGGGTNSAPICRSVAVPTGNPTGVIDTVAAAPGSITVTGWMLDPDTTAAIQIGATLDGVAVAPVTANGVKTGLGAAFPGYGDNHDYTVSFAPTSGGNHTVCVYGINVGSGVNSAPICRTISIPTGSPYGVIDSAVSSGSAISVTGWMIDPDTVSPISVQIYVNGVLKDTVTAGGVKTGLNAAFPGYTDNHDYSDSIPITSNVAYQVCVVGVNVGGGSDSSQICVSVPAATS